MIFVVFIILFLFSISSFLMFDGILRIQYKNHRSEWDKDGKPHGFFFVPEETKSFGGLFVKFGSSFAKDRRFYSLLWKTPEWMLSESRALKLLFWFRVLSFVGLSLGLFWMYLVMFFRR